MLKRIADTLTNCFKIPELKSRIFFTLMVLAIARVVALVPAPGVDATRLKAYFAERGGGPDSLMGLYSLFTGGAFENMAIGALGIMPYISAMIIIQLLTAVLPRLSKLAREEGGRTKIIQYARYMTLVLCLGQGFVMAIGWERPEAIFTGFEGNLVIAENIWWFRIQTMIVLATGTMLLMWMGEQITDRGIGNGISLIITIGILAQLPQAGQGVMMMFFTGDRDFHLFHAIALILLLLAVVAGVTAVTQAQRKIPVQYAQRAVGRKVYSGGSSFMPLRVNYAGVMPVIFAQAILMFPAQMLSFMGESLDVVFLNRLATLLQHGSLLYLTVYALMILFFSYFWVATQFNELQIADDMKKSGGYIPGVRPGQATSDFLHRTMSRLTLAGAIFLCVIAVIPIILSERVWNIPITVSQFFGGTSLLIIVGVMLDTMRQMESHLMMRHYDGFLKKGRIRGRF